MKLSALQKIRFQRLFFIILSWTVIVLLLFIYEYTAVRIRAPQIADEIDIGFNLFINLYAGIFAGLLGGPFLVFSVSKKTRNRPFYFGILYTAIGFLLIYVVISFSISLIVFSNNLQSPVYSKEVLRETINNLLAVWQIKNIIIWTIIISTTQFLLQINDKFGPGNLWKFIRGKYYNPREEKRVFMFLDLKSSTTIAEKIGHKMYYNLLNDFYALITDPIINHLGEIYQYVGDEIVVSWEKEKAFKDQNCISCFYEIKTCIEHAESRFINIYGVVPEFKAGMHSGTVTVGEIGLMKRDIIYTGDVLNTTSRIQEACNLHQAELLVSDEITRALDNSESYQIKNIGEIQLKGKSQKVNIASLRKKE
jgi:adenylate cyclase